MFTFVVLLTHQRHFCSILYVLDETFYSKLDIHSHVVTTKMETCPSPLKKLLLVGLEVLFEVSLAVADPRIAAQLLGFEAEPRLACAEVRVVADTLLRWT